MAFVLTLAYIAFTLLSPNVFPPAVANLHIAMVLGLLTILVAIPSIEKSKIATIPDGFLALALLLGAIISTLATGWAAGTVYTFLAFFPTLSVFFFIAISCTSIPRLKTLVRVMLAVAIFIVLQGIIAEQLGIYPHPYLLSEGAADGMLYRHRGLGVLNDPNDLAQFLVMLIPMLWLWWKPGNFLRNFFFTLVPAAFLISGIFYTRSRGGTIALVAVLLFGFKDKLGLIKSSIIAGFGMVGFLLLNVGGGRGMGEDDGGRVAFWATGLQTLKHHPIFGIGFGNFGDIVGGRTAHNSFILGMVELGVFGYFFWMAMLVSAWSALSALIGSKPKLTVEDDSTPNTFRSKPAVRQLRPSAQFLQPLTAGPSFAGAGGATMLSTSRVASDLPPEPLQQTPANAFNNSVGTDEVAPSATELAYAANVVRTSFVGFITAAMFLSRTYATTLYIVLGIAVALVNLSPTRVSLTWPVLTKWTLLITFSSIVFMYIAVTIHGGR